MVQDPLPYSGELARKALHLLALVIPAGMLMMERTTALTILVPCALAAVWLDTYRTRNKRVSDWLDAHLGFMMRPTERGNHPDILFNGATWVMVTAAVLLAVFPAQFAAPAIVIAMIADAAAALVGRKIGRHKWPGTKRSVEGTAAFVATGLLTAMLFPEVPLEHRAAAVGVAAVAEIPPLPVNDNLVLPTVVAAVLWLLAGSPPLW